MASARSATFIALLLLAGCFQEIAVVAPGCDAEGSRCCAGDLCGSGLRCEDDRCRVCGAAGQACCPGSSCGAGALCGSDDRCTACGGLGQVCCAVAAGVSACGTDQVCGAGRCVAVCGAGCQPGTGRCGAGGIPERCDLDAESCTRWSALEACPAGLGCQNGTCSRTCGEACVSGSRLCTLDGELECRADQEGCLAYRAPAGPPVPCLSGLLDVSGIGWEHPLPGPDLLRLAALRSGVLLAEDEGGNLLERDGLGTWRYAARASQPLPRRVVSCRGTSSAISQDGEAAVLLRTDAGWVRSAFPPTATPVSAVACDDEGHAALLETSGRVTLQRSPGATWAPLPSPGTDGGSWRALAFFADGLWAAGPAGAAQRCATGQGGGCSSSSLPLGPVRRLVRGWEGTSRECALSDEGQTACRLGSGRIFEAGPTFGIDTLDAALNGQLSSEFSAIRASGEMDVVARLDGSTATPLQTLPVGEAGSLVAVEAEAGGEGLWVSGTAGRLWSVGPAPARLVRPLGGGVAGVGTLRAVQGYRLADGTEELFAVGDRGVILRRTRLGWVRDDRGDDTRDLHALLALGPDDVWAFGARGAIRRRVQGGWSDAAPGLVQVGLNAAVADATTMWVAGAAGTLLERPRNGTSFQLRQSGTSELLAATRVTNAAGTETRQVWFVGTGCAALVLDVASGRLVNDAVGGLCSARNTTWSAAASASDELVLTGEGRLIRSLGGIWSEQALPAPFAAGTSIDGVELGGSRPQLVGGTATVARRVPAGWEVEVESLARRRVRGMWRAPWGTTFFVGERGLIWSRR